MERAIDARVHVNGPFRKSICLGLSISLYIFSVYKSMGDRVDSSPLIAPSPITDPNEIDLEAGHGEQIQCRICLEIDGKSALISSIWFSHMTSFPLFQFLFRIH